MAGRASTKVSWPLAFRLPLSRVICLWTGGLNHIVNHNLPGLIGLSVIFRSARKYAVLNLNQFFARQNFCMPKLWMGNRLDFVLVCWWRFAHGHTWKSSPV